MLIALLAVFFYFSFAYHLNRVDFIKLFAIYSILFFISFRQIQLEKRNFWFLAGLGLIYRLIFLAALPNLSQDFYRFIWDGNLLLEGINPYLYTPNEFANTVSPHNNHLIEGMGELSASNFTNYPPVNQVFFAVSSLMAGKSILGSVIFLRVFIILAEIGLLYFGKKLLENLKLPSHHIFWYYLNPFIIIELTGNLHFEAVMLFFLVWALCLLHQQKWKTSAVIFGISISVKLLPLLFLPLFFRYFIQKNKKAGLKKLLLFYTIVLTTVVFTFLPFISAEMFRNFSRSISLWFQKFEFNASIYYLVRWVGFQVKGYNIIETAGKILPALTVLILLALSFFRKNSSIPKLLTSMLLGISAYFFLSTTVHPWYLATPLLLAVFTHYRFALLWSFLVMLSYFAYSSSGFKENYGLLAIEYLLVLGFFLFEIRRYGFKEKEKLF